MMAEVRENLRRMTYEVAEAVAPGWERRRASIEEVAAPVRNWMIEALAPSEGDTVLELACGAGDTGFEAAAIVGDNGLLIASDFSPRMLEAARRRGEEIGARNVDFEVMDAEDIGLEDDSVDGVLCRFGYMLMADPAAALAETRRVLRPGGRLSLAVWGSPERNPFFTTIAMALVQRDLMPPPDLEAPGIFFMASADRTAGLLEGAGFVEVRTEEIAVELPMASVDEYVEFVKDTSGPIAFALMETSAEQREELNPRLEEAMAPFAADRSYVFPGVALAAVAS
jgi:ubiquinone/menaquinone biosynthesis C-methylase UbiE